MTKIVQSLLAASALLYTTAAFAVTPVEPKPEPETTEAPAPQPAPTPDGAPAPQPAPQEPSDGPAGPQ